MTQAGPWAGLSSNRRSAFRPTAAAPGGTAFGLKADLRPFPGGIPLEAYH
jgi:hypothetical protein